MSVINVEYDGITQIQERMQRFGKGAGQVIQGVYEDFAAKDIKQNVLPLVRSSGRTFKGHRQSAKAAGPEKVFRHNINQLSLVVRTNTKFGYLYFPDDGTNTKRHAGRQNFMGRGLERSTNDIVERCLAALADEF